jgi:hypothetical protein
LFDPRRPPNIPSLLPLNVTTLEKAKDSTQHRDALADIVVKLTDSGMEYYFLKAAEACQGGFFSSSSQPTSAWQLQPGYWHRSSATS